MNHTLAIIKPDAVASGKTGKIIAHIQDAGFKVLAMRLTHLTQSQARAFYERSGYELFGELDHYPQGHRRFFMRKRL